MFEIVPGVSSAVAVPAYAGIPLTDRRFSSSFVVVTGHEDTGKRKPSVHWERIAMGLKTLPKIAAKLIAHGRAPETPVALIQWGTTDAQETVTGTLDDITDKAASLTSPVVVVIGDVVNLRDQLRWFNDIAATVHREDPIDGAYLQIQP
jgi:siroheme synthase